MNGGIITRLQAWAAQPFTTDMDLGAWILFTIFIVTVTALWVVVIRKLENKL